MSRYNKESGKPTSPMKIGRERGDTMGIHDGHRKRLRQRFAQQGADGFQDHELLEYLLQFSLPRVDTNPLAHRLMDRFGSFSSVLDAPVESLLQVEGVGPGTAAFSPPCPGSAAGIIRTATPTSSSIPATAAGAICCPASSADRWRPCFWCVWTASAKCWPACGSAKATPQWPR